MLTPNRNKAFLFTGNNDIYFSWKQAKGGTDAARCVVVVYVSFSLSDEASYTKLGCADAVVVAESPAALADDHRLHVAWHRVEAGLRHARWLRQQRHPVWLQHHLVPLVRLRLQAHVGGGGGGEGGGDYLLWNYLDGGGGCRMGLLWGRMGGLNWAGHLLLLLCHLCCWFGWRGVHTCRSCGRWRRSMTWWWSRGSSHRNATSDHLSSTQAWRRDRDELTFRALDQDVFPHHCASCRWVAIAAELQWKELTNL